MEKVRRRLTACATHRALGNDAFLSKRFVEKIDKVPGLALHISELLGRMELAAREALTSDDPA